jgi:hypothetical protein
MNNMDLLNITSASIAEDIISLSKGRFTVSNDEQFNEIVEEITPELLTDRFVMSLKRDWPNSVGERTILISVLDSPNDFKIALQWAAAIKDEILEPANGDLYLFIIIKGKELSIEQCTDIESSDRICRRYVLRPTETIEEFLSRSFIAPVMSDASTTGISDPLYLALEKTATTHQWFTHEEQQTWQQVLLSGKTGQELIDSLFKIQN